MNYKDEIKELLKHPFIKVCGSSLSLKLIKIYSDLYEGGREVRACENSQRKYYELLQKEGYKMAVNHEAVKNRTCVPNWKGNVYSHSIGEHLNDEHMTDEKAISLLNKKLIPEDFFKKLPDGYKPASAKVDEEKSEVKRGRKPKTE